jgi:ribosomal protein S18 acetylase RimI-like enzyme
MRLFQRSSTSFDIIDQVKVRQVRRSDLRALEWDGEFTHFRRLYEASYHSARKGNSILWIVESSTANLIGQLFVQLTSSRLDLANGHNRAYIYGFRIKPAYRNKGIGTLMMEKAESDLRKRGYGTVTLNVGRENPGARRLYERLGYRVVAEEAGIWSYTDHEGKICDVHEPSWRMEKILLALHAEN